MNRTLIQFLVILVLFLGVFFALGSLNLVRIFHVDELRKNTEQKLGDVLYKNLQENSDEIKNSPVNRLLDRLKRRICDQNGIDASKIKINLFISDEVNAFALPDNHLVIYTGLITECHNPEELCGVMGHEIGHMEHKHVMKKLTKEIGLSAIVAMTSGGGSSEAITRIIKTLSSTAYDRSLESEADMASMDYMIKADIDPTQFPKFLGRMGEEKEEGIPSALYWISTHPESKERAKTLEDYIKKMHYIVNPVLSEAEWQQLKHGM